MSGTDAGPKRRKRRKTRAERNMSRNPMTKLQQDQKHKSSKREAHPSTVQANPSISYTLRGGRGANAFVPTNYKSATSGTITQDRMTTTYRMLANSKSSDWIRRGPIPETESVKKKVENDLKRILNLAEGTSTRGNCTKSPAQNNADVMEALQGHSSQGDQEAEHCAMEVDVSVLSSQKSDTHQITDTSGRNPQALGQKSLLAKDVTTKTNASFPSVTRKDSSRKSATKSSHITESLTPSPAKSDQSLEPEVPLQEVADKLLKDVKTKFAAMFPDRDIQKELCYDLHKLVKQSSCDIAASKSEQNREASISLAECNVYSPVLRLSTQSPRSSTLAACRPAAHGLYSTQLPELSHTVDGNTYLHSTERTVDSKGHLACSAEKSALPPLNRREENSGAFCDERAKEEEESGMKSFFPDQVVKEDSQSPEPIILIVKAPSSEISSEDDNDELGGLTTACCDAFLADARDMEAQQQGTRLRSRKGPLGLIADEQGCEWMEDVNSKCVYPPTSQASNRRNSFISNNLNGKSWHIGAHNPVDLSSRCSETRGTWVNASPQHSFKLPSLPCSATFDHHGSTFIQSSISSQCGDTSNHFHQTSADIARGRLRHSCMQSSPSFSNPTILPHKLSGHGQRTYRSQPINDGFLAPIGDETSSHSSYSRLHQRNRPSLFPNQQDLCPRSGLIDAGSFLNVAESHHCGQAGNPLGHDYCSISSGARTRAASRLVPSYLSQSRHNFQTALNSAFKDSVSAAEFRPCPEPMDEDDIFGSICDGAPSLPFLGGSNQLSVWQRCAGQPLAEMQSHQDDMQRQARDFLDGMDKGHHQNPLSKKDFHPPLFGEVLPSSRDAASSSFVMGPSTRSKDLSLKVGSFI